MSRLIQEGQVPKWSAADKKFIPGSGSAANFNSPFNYGAVGDGVADDSVAWQDCVDDTDDGDLIWSPTWPIYKISDLINVEGRQGLTIKGGSSVRHAGGIAPTFRWAGTGAGNVLLGIYSCNAITFEGFNIDIASGGVLDVAIDSNTTSGYNGNQAFRRLFINAQGHLVPNPNFIGIAIGRSGLPPNNENFLAEDVTIIGMRDSIFYGAGPVPSVMRSSAGGQMTSGNNVLTLTSGTFTSNDIGLRVRVGAAGAMDAYSRYRLSLDTTIQSVTDSTHAVLSTNAQATVTTARVHVGQVYGVGILNQGDHANPKHQQFRDLGLSDLAKGLQSNGGSFSLCNFGGNNNEIDVYSLSNNEPVVVDQLVTEAARQGIFMSDAIGGTGTPFRITNARGSNSHQLTEGYYVLNGPATVIDSSRSEELPPPGGQYIAWNAGLFLTSIDNVWSPNLPTMAQLGFKKLYESPASNSGLTVIENRNIADAPSKSFSNATYRARLAVEAGPASTVGQRTEVLTGVSTGGSQIAIVGAVGHDPNDATYGDPAAITGIQGTLTDGARGNEKVAVRATFEGTMAETNGSKLYGFKMESFAQSSIGFNNNDAYGVYIPNLSVTNIRRGYAFCQDGAADLNIFKGLLAQGEGAVLSVVSNAIAPTHNIHHVGAGLIKNITLPANFMSGTIYLIPDAAFTTDTTGNIASPATAAVVGKPMAAAYSASSGKWYLM